MKTYIQPSTQATAISMPIACMQNLSLSGPDNQGNAMSPQRQFTGDYYSSLKYLI